MTADVTNATFAPSSEFVAQANVTKDAYDTMYTASLTDPEGFWGEQAKRVDWIKPFTQVKDVSFAPGNVSINWFADGTLNVAAN
ncbi:acetyl-coenzyme A synthetase, partial [Epibacterium ulvae]|uniref:acetyl-coenzyme A synthetase N-terminal domain-containing protein n=1 Tax=Epibacterium ulvae TaxID=1156985 RepID=UPI00255B376A